MLEHVESSESRLLYKDEWDIPVKVHYFHFESEDSHQAYYRNWDPEESEWGSTVFFGKLEALDDTPTQLPDGTEVEFRDEVMLLSHDGLSNGYAPVYEVVGTATAELVLEELSEADRLTEEELREKVQNAPRLLEESPSIGESESKQLSS